jgi:dipeptidyl aminopeptidase
MPPQYDPLTQEDDTTLDDDGIQQINTARGGLYSRPEIYYGEGPFDAPSSDDDEDAITEKDRRDQLNRAEHGVLLNPGSVDSGLYVGGQKVRSHELLA